MEPEITERDVALLMMSESSWVTLGAVLGLRPWMRPDDEPLPDPMGHHVLPA
jgi:hypothetical protein